MATPEFLAAKAAEMRAAPTKAERYLRHILPTCDGWSFQVPLMGAYIADFYHEALGLVVEADGGYHDADLQRLKDDNRDRVMRSGGFQVLRFTNREIYQRQAWVLECIARRLNVIRRLRDLPLVPERKHPETKHRPNTKEVSPRLASYHANPLGLSDYRKTRWV